MSMSDHNNQRFYKIFCPKGPILLKNSRTEFFCFTRVGEPAHILKIKYITNLELRQRGTGGGGGGQLSNKGR